MEIDHFTEQFYFISIRGRYIFGYLCLQKVIDTKKLKTPPTDLERVLHSFVSFDRLDLWHDLAEELLPSIILDPEHKTSSPKLNHPDAVSLVEHYYKTQPKYVVDIIENLMWLGISNLYSGYDHTLTIEYLRKITAITYQETGILPDFEKVKNCSVKERHGWGENTEMKLFLN